MEDREKQIEELQTILINNGVFNNLVCRQDYANPDALINDLCHETAVIIYDNGYRKMDEVTLRIDLGDCTPEQINEIMEKFSKAAETSSCVAVPNNNEEEIRKKTAIKIFKTILEDYKGVDYYEFLFEGIQALADDEYGIRIMKNGNEISVEVDE